MKKIKQLIRNLNQYRRYTIPNMLGLSVAFGTLFLIFQFVSFQLSFDRFYENELYRVIATKFQGDKEILKSTVTYSAVGPALLADYPQVINQSRVFPFGNSIVNHQGKGINITRCVGVEKSFFEMFELELLAGDKETIFNEPNQLVLTTSTAAKIFGSEMSHHDMINASVKLDNDEEHYTVAGIVEDLRANSHLSYNLFLSYPTIISTWGLSQARYDWNMIDFRHYVQLQEGTNLSQLNAELSAFGPNYLDMTSSEYEMFELERVEDVYLSSNAIAYDIALHGDWQTIVLLILLGVVLFIVSLINFINLNSSLALRRTKNIGIQKVLGIGKKSLRASLLLDVLIVYGMAIGLGIVVAYIETSLLQKANFDIMKMDELIRKDYLYFPAMAGLGALIILGGLISAFIHYNIASRVKPTDALKARQGKVKGTSFASRLSLTLQFIFSVIAFSMGLIVFHQQKHLQDAPMGFDLENLWVLQQPRLTASDSTFKTKLNTFKNMLQADPRITSVTTNQRTPGQQLQVEYNVEVGTTKQTSAYLFADNDYIDTYEIELVAGRAFTDYDITPQFSEMRQAIVNRSWLESFGYESPIEALGVTVHLFGLDLEIVGVVENYRQESLLQDFQPTILLPYVSSNYQIVFETTSAPEEWLESVQRSYELVFPGNSFEYRHLESEYQLQYSSVYSASRSLGLFTLLTVIIALFGMVALASLNLLSRLREISIRKVLGASTSSLYRNVVKEYLKILAVAFTIALPAVYILSDRWMEQFKSSIDIGLFYYFVPLTLLSTTVIVVLLLISRKVVGMNPVEVLKGE